MAIDRNEVAAIARRAIQTYIDAIHTCTDLAECQAQAVLQTVDDFTPSTADAVSDIETGCEISKTKAVLNSFGHPPVVEVARLVRAHRNAYMSYLAGDADSELPRYIREEILRPYGQEGGPETGNQAAGCSVPPPPGVNCKIQSLQLAARMKANSRGANRGMPMLEKLMRLWCVFAHTEMSGPLPSGEYECYQCLRRYPVPWAVQSR